MIKLEPLDKHVGPDDQPTAGHRVRVFGTLSVPDAKDLSAWLSARGLLHAASPQERCLGSVFTDRIY